MVKVHAVGSGARGRTIALSLAALVLILCSASALTAQTITRVQAANLQDKVQIGITASKPLSFVVKQHAHASYLVFDVKGYYAPTKPGRLRVGSSKIRSVRYGRFRSNPPVTRIAVAAKGKVEYTATYQDGQKKLLIDVWKSGKPVAAKPTAAVKPAPKVVVVVPAVAVPAAQSSPADTAKPAASRIAKTAVMGVATPVVDQPAETPEAALRPTPAPVVNVAAAPVVAAAVPEIAGASPAHITRRGGDTEASSSFDAARNISLDFHAADINDVLKALALQSGTNIVAGSDVKGNVTVTLNRASLDDALTYVAKLSGYNYAKAEDGTYLVGNNVGAAMGTEAGGIVTEAMTLRLVVFDDSLGKMMSDMFPTVKIAFPKAPDAAKAVEDTGAVPLHHLVTAQGQPFKLDPSKGLSTVLLSGPAGDVAKAKVAIQQMEESLTQYADGSTTRTYQVKRGNVTQLVEMIKHVVPAVTVTWATDATKLEGSDLGNQPDYIVLTGPEPQVNQAVKMLDEVDIKPAQILLEAKVMDVTNDALRDVGLDWSWSSFNSSQTVNIDNAKGHKQDVLVDPDGNVLPIDTPVNTRVVARALALGPFDLMAKLNLMVTTSKARLLANPKVAALEGKTANIFIGDQIKYVISIQNTSTGQNIQTETADVGIRLRGIGTVGANDEITMQLHPEVSVISSFLNLGNGIALPQIATRFTDSTIRIKNGETIVVGGLIRDQDIASMSKVPFLGDLPLVGQLFRHKSKTKNHSEIVVFITATVLKD